MKVLLSYSVKDYNLAFYAVETMLNKTDVNASDVFLYGSQHAPLPDKNLQDSIGGTIQCTGDSNHYPLGANQMFTGAMRLMQKWDEPTFLCESDGFPTCSDWQSRIEEAHKELGTLCSGSWVGWVNPKHFNGNMVVHPDCLKLHPCLGRVTYEAWDCFHAEFFLNNGAANKEILNARRKMRSYPSKWWDDLTQADGHRPAWIHGCQTFQMWERIANAGC